MAPALCSVVTTLQSLACKAILASVSMCASPGLSVCLSFSFHPLSTLWLTLFSFYPSVWPSFSLLCSHPGTYQRQGNLICPAVRRTLTELNVWFPFIRVHLRTAAQRALHIPPRHRLAFFALSFRSIFQLKLDRPEKFASSRYHRLLSLSPSLSLALTHFPRDL